MAACKGCGRPIVWGRTLDDKRIPLDPKAPVYKIVAREPSSDQAEVERAAFTMVSHFATCPEANKFSASNKEKQNEQKNLEG